MERVPPVLLLLGLFALILLALWWGWRGRRRRQSDIPAPQPPSVSATAMLRHGPAEGVYVSTVLAASPLERVVAHGLGTRSPVQVSVTQDGTWLLERTGAPSFEIPAEQIQDLTATSGQAGKFMTGTALLAIHWRPAPDAEPLMTAVRLRRRADHDQLLSWKETP